MSRREKESVEKIKSISATLFREKGYEGSTVRDIASACEILPGSLHYRFASKEDLLMAIMEGAFERTFTDLRESVKGPHDPAIRLKKATLTYLHALLTHDDLYVLMHEGRSLEGQSFERVKVLRMRLQSFFDGLFYQIEGAGYLDTSVEVEVLRQLWISTLHGITQWYTATSGMSEDQAAELYWKLLTSGLFSHVPSDPAE